MRPYRVHITRTDHPITRGVEDFVVEDEQHFMQYEKDPAHVLAVSVNDDGHTWQDLGTTCEAAWAYDYGAGPRVLSITGTHHPRAVESGLREVAAKCRALAAAR